MYIIIDEDGTAYKTDEVTDDTLAAVDAGIWSVIDIGDLFTPMELSQINGWVEIKDIKEDYPG